MTAATTATASAHLSRVHRSGSEALLQRAIGPTPIKNTAGASSG